MYRYAEGAGTTARFSIVSEIDFLSSTELICTDYLNHCLRHVDLSLSPPTTSTFAGNCTLYGDADGHRVNTALFKYAAYTEVKKDNSAVFVLEATKALRMIDLKTGNVTTLLISDTLSYSMKLVDDNLLYVTQKHLIALIDQNTGEENVVAGELTHGSAIGLFEHTKFHDPQGLLPWRDRHLLVADQNNNRFAGFFLRSKNTISF